MGKTYKDNCFCKVCKQWKPKEDMATDNICEECYDKDVKKSS